MTRKMKDSGVEWIGEIPEDWKVIRVKDKYNIQIGFTPSTSNSNNYTDIDGNEWVTISDLVATKVLTQPTKNQISNRYVLENNPKIVPGGSLLYSFKLSVGQKCFTNRNIYTNEAIAAFVDNDDISLKFLYYSSDLIEYNSNTNIYGAKILNQELIKNATLPFPTISEQIQIATFLDQKTQEIEDIKSLIDSEIQVLEDYKKSLITEAVTKGLDKDVEMKDSGIEWIGEIPKKATITRLKNVVLKEITDGTHQTPEYDDEVSGSPFLSSKDITKGYIDWSEIKYITKELHIKLQNEVSPQRDDILLAKNGTTGIAAIVDTDRIFDIYVTLALIRPNKSKILPKYLLYMLNSDIAKTQFNRHLLGIGVPNLHLNVIRNIYIVLYDTDEQQQIVNYLDEKCSTIDSAISKKQKQLEVLEEYKKSLIYEYVTGKKEVKDV